MMIFAGDFLHRVFEITLLCRIWFIHFRFQLVEKFEHIQTIQLIEIKFRFVENIYIYYIVKLVHFKKSDSIKWIV